MDSHETQVKKIIFNPNGMLFNYILERVHPGDYYNLFQAIRSFWCIIRPEDLDLWLLNFLIYITKGYKEFLLDEVLKSVDILIKLLDRKNELCTHNATTPKMMSVKDYFTVDMKLTHSLVRLKKIFSTYNSLTTLYLQGKKEYEKVKIGTLLNNDKIPLHPDPDAVRMFFIVRSSGTEWRFNFFNFNQEFIRKLHYQMTYSVNGNRRSRNNRRGSVPVHLKSWELYTSCMFDRENKERKLFVHENEGEDNNGWRDIYNGQFQIDVGEYPLSAITTNNAGWKEIHCRTLKTIPEHDKVAKSTMSVNDRSIWFVYDMFFQINSMMTERTDRQKQKVVLGFKI